MPANLWADRRLHLPHGTLMLREAAPAAPGLPVLLLHGISSGAGSWQALAEALPGRRLLAWDAPGYGHSTPLPASQPSADDLAQVADQALQHLGLTSVLLVGHSLGCLVATALATRLQARRQTRQQAQPGSPRVAGLLLLSPAQGYARDPARAAQVQADRLRALAEQGVDGLAQTVSRRLLSAQASPAQHAQIRQVAQGLTPGGYTQAVHLLCSSDLAGLAAPLLPGQAGALPLHIACGSDDIVTPPQACAALATAFGAPFTLLPGAGHACSVEQPEAVAGLIAKLIAELTARIAPDETP